MRRSFAAMVALVALGSSLPLVACGGLVVGPGPSPGDDPVGDPSLPGSTRPALPGTAVSPPPSGSGTPRPPTCLPERCALPRVEAHTCRNDACAPAVCEAGWLDCDGISANGCETAAEPRYADEDGDGLGASTPTTACPKPGVTYVDNHDDCDDTSALVRPGQTAFFTRPRADGTFDYDCSGEDEARGTKAYTGECVCGALGCSLSEGWIGAVPGCGETGTWARSPGGGSCTPIQEQRGQACR